MSNQSNHFRKQDARGVFKYIQVKKTATNTCPA